MAQMDYKSELNKALQKHCRRPITKTDVMYTLNTFGHQCQGVVKLNCLDGQEYAGHLANDPKVAGQSAAEQAFNANQATFAASAAIVTPVGVKRPRVQGGEPAAKMATGELGVRLPRTEKAAKTELNNACQKICQRTIQKGEIAFNVTEIGSQFQATVQCSCLPGDFAARAWAGELKDSRPAAEASAAAQAVNDIQNAPDFALKLAEPSKSKPKNKKGSWTKTMNAMMSQLMSEGVSDQPVAQEMVTWLQSGCQGTPPRENVSPVPVSGVVEKWKKTFGWLKADVPIQHEAACLKKGMIYINMKDFAVGSGLTELVEGQRVRFKVFADPTGLGAEELTLE
eukprot:TRINITY_DN29795_c0_g1_i1.p1 TRINITY_DN29795_c0_g1~~TRINITY_DN29795_c0_g1_i1.p1  ORF type:complete len:340 (-),score=74.93 TRINITY_DN29795_c0_g1_i1:43-1062(-)